MSGLISRRWRRPCDAAPVGRFARRAAPLIPVVALVAALGCGGGSDSKTPTQSAAESKAAPLTSAELEQRVRPSTVSIVAQPPGEARAPSEHGEHAHGSGVIWDVRRGLVLTSDHLVENAGSGSIEVVVNGQAAVHARLVARAQCNDVAILRLHPKPTGMTAVQLGDSSALAVGSQVTALGYLKPASAAKPKPISTNGAVSAVDVPSSLSPDLPDFPKVVLHQAPLQDQMSGGPLVNDRGQLVGVSTLVPGAPSTGQFAAVSSSYLKRRIQELKPDASGLFGGWKDQHACHGKMTKIANRVLVSHGAPGEHEHGH
jgi:S1-C subfamily serine protease